MRVFCISSLLLFLLLGGFSNARPFANDNLANGGRDYENVVEDLLSTDDSSDDNDDIEGSDEDSDKKSIIDTNDQENKESDSSSEEKKQEENKDEKKDEDKTAGFSIEEKSDEEKSKDKGGFTDEESKDDENKEKKEDENKNSYASDEKVDGKQGEESKDENKDKTEFASEEAPNKDGKKPEKSEDEKSDNKENNSKKEDLNKADKGSKVDEEMEKKKEEDQNKSAFSDDQEDKNENKDDQADSFAGKEDGKAKEDEEEKKKEDEKKKEEEKKKREEEEKKKKEEEEKQKKEEEERKKKEEEEKKKKKEQEKEEKEKEEKEKEEEKKKEEGKKTGESSSKSNIEKLKEDEDDEEEDGPEETEEKNENEKKVSQKKKKGKKEGKAFSKQILTYPAVRHGWDNTHHWGPAHIYNRDYPFFAYGYSWGCGHHMNGGHFKKSKLGKKNKKTPSFKCRDYILMPTAYFIRPMHAVSQPQQETATSRQMISKDIACNDGDRNCAARQVIGSMAGGSLFGDGMGGLGMGFPGVPGIHTGLAGYNMAGGFGDHAHGHGGGHGADGGYGGYGGYGGHGFDTGYVGEGHGCIDNCDGINADIGDDAAGLKSTGEHGFSSFWSSKDRIPSDKSYEKRWGPYGDNSVVDPAGFGNFGSFGRPVNYNPGWYTKTALLAGNTEGGWNNGWGDFGSHKYGPGAGWGVNFENERRSKALSKNPKDDIGDFGSYGRPVNSNSDWHSKTALMAGNTEGGWNNGWGDFGSHRYGPAAGWGVNFDNERRSKTLSKNPKESTENAASRQDIAMPEEQSMIDVNNQRQLIGSMGASTLFADNVGGMGLGHPGPPHTSSGVSGIPGEYSGQGGFGRGWDGESPVDNDHGLGYGRGYGANSGGFEGDKREEMPLNAAGEKKQQIAQEVASDEAVPGEPANGQLTLANEEAANFLANPIQNLHTAPLTRDSRPVATSYPLPSNVPIIQQDDNDGGAALLTRPRPVHVHVAAPNVEVEVQSMKHGLVALKPKDVSADKLSEIRKLVHEVSASLKKTGDKLNALKKGENAEKKQITPAFTPVVSEPAGVPSIRYPVPAADRYPLGGGYIWPSANYGLQYGGPYAWSKSTTPKKPKKKSKKKKTHHKRSADENKDAKVKTETNQQKETKRQFLASPYGMHGIGGRAYGHAGLYGGVGHLGFEGRGVFGGFGGEHGGFGGLHSGYGGYGGAYGGFGHGIEGYGDEGYGHHGGYVLEHSHGYGGHGLGLGGYGFAPFAVSHGGYGHGYGIHGFGGFGGYADHGYGGDHGLGGYGFGGHDGLVGHEGFGGHDGYGLADGGFSGRFGGFGGVEGHGIGHFGGPYGGRGLIGGYGEGFGGHDNGIGGYGALGGLGGAYSRQGIGRQEMEQPAVPDPTGSMFRSAFSGFGGSPMNMGYGGMRKSEIPKNKNAKATKSKKQ